MLIALLVLVSESADQNAFRLLAATAIPLVLYHSIKKIKRNFLLHLLFRKKRLKSGLQNTRGGRILLGLILSIGTGALIGLFFGWTIGLWVAIGIGGIMFLYFLFGEKIWNPPQRKPESERARENRIERERRAREIQRRREEGN